MRVLLKDPDNNSDLFAVEVDAISIDNKDHEVQLSGQIFLDILVQVPEDDLNSLPKHAVINGYLDLSQYPSYWDDTPVVSAE